MKLYRHPIMCASSALDDTTPQDICSSMFEQKKQFICDKIKLYAGYHVKNHLGRDKDSRNFYQEQINL